MKLFVSEFKQESNSFNPTCSDMASFERLGILRGKELLSVTSGLHVAVKGIVDGICAHGGEIVPGIAMCSGSAGPVEQNVVDYFLTEIEACIREYGPFDGAVLSLHGATLTKDSDDVCGDILALVRRLLGEHAIVAASLDLHANITEKMLKNADFLTGFQTYPHLDQYETGYRAACLSMRRLLGTPLKMYRAAVPTMVSPNHYTTERGEIKALMESAAKMVADGRLADYSIFQVQPWLNVPEISSSILTVGTDPVAAEQCALELAMQEFRIRASLQQNLYSFDDVIAQVLNEKKEKPVVLVDSADSPGAGATCDSAEVLEKLLPYAGAIRAAFPLSDRAAAERAHQLGVGTVAEFTLGASIAPKLTNPITVTAEVKSLHKGVFRLEGPATRGGVCDIGHSAVLTVGKIEILVCGYATRTGDPQFYRGFGIEPSMCDLVVIKACTSFRAAYEPISEAIYCVQTPGAANAELTSLPYTRLPKPLYPFDEISEADICSPACYRK